MNDAKACDQEIKIVPVASREELHQVGRLRYSVTVQEMGLRMRHADHGQQTVIEPMDSDGHVLAAWCGNEVVGTVRTNLLTRSDVGGYFTAYAVDRFPSHYRAAMSITTRLAIAARYRGGRLFWQLSLAMYQYLLAEGVEHDVIDCRKRLARYFVRLGYRVHKPDFAHPEFGDVTVLWLSTRDAIHLRAVGSPFLKTLDAFREQDALLAG